jgi:hypothetical protein
MTIPFLRPSEIVEIASYNLFISAIAFASAGTIITAPQSNVSPSMQGIGFILGLFALLFWRLRSSIKDRVDTIIQKMDE